MYAIRSYYGIGQAGLGQLDRKRWQHVARIANEKDIAGFAEKAEIEIDEVVCHVLDKEPWFGVFLV